MRDPVKYVPEWFPGAGFQKLGKKWRVNVLRLKNAPFDFTKDAMVGIQESRYSELNYVH